MRRSVGLSFLSLLLAACGSGDEGSDVGDATARAEATSDGETSTTTIEAEGGTATIRSGPGAAIDLPFDFEIYPGAEVVTSTSFDRDGDRGALVTMLSDASADEMMAFYRAAAENAGVKIEMELKTDNSQIIGGKAGDTAFSFTAVPGRDGKTQGQLMIGSGG